MLRYIYNNIFIFGTNVIILEFFSANILTSFSQELEYKNNEGSQTFNKFSFWLQRCQSF